MRFQLLIVILLIALIIPSLSYAVIEDCAGGSGSGGAAICNPLPVGTENLGIALSYFARTLAFLMGLTVIVYVVFAGFRMIMSQGNTEEIEAGKRTLQWSLLGFGLTIVAYALIVAVQRYIGINENISEDGTLENPITANPFGPTNTFGDLLINMLRGFLSVAGVLSILIIVISGYRYITAQGNEEQTEQAKTSLQWAIIGLAISLLAFVIVSATAQLLTR